MKIFLIFLIVLFLSNALSNLAYADADTSLIKSHLITITKTAKYRNYHNIDQLNITADYIKKIFSEYTDSITIQEYLINGKTFKNIIASFGTENKKRIIVGAHYDVCDNQEGADDNASGVVALLELSRLLKNKKLNQRVDLVAYTLEEPPFFRSQYMGSYVHAKYLKDNNIAVSGMVSIEMIAFFKEEKHTQEYPIKPLKFIYGNRGNYITLVKKINSGRFTKLFCKQYKSNNTIRTIKFTGPALLPGIDFSDHLNYWKFGYSALMITDTAFYRNKNYHENTDVLETLDLYKMAKVIDGVYLTLLAL